MSEYGVLLLWMCFLIQHNLSPVQVSIFRKDFVTAKEDVLMRNEEPEKISKTDLK